MSPKVIRYAGYAVIIAAFIVAGLIFSGTLAASRAWIPVLVIFASLLIYFLPENIKS